MEKQLQYEKPKVERYGTLRDLTLHRPIPNMSPLAARS
jgi:hypothetical protein